MILPTLPSRRRLLRGGAVLAVLAVAWVLRERAVQLLPPDYDEDDYLRAGQQYAVGLQAHDPGVLVRENYRPEHPQLMKLLYGAALTPLPPVAEIPDRPTTAEPDKGLPPVHLRAARQVSAVAGTLAVGLAACLSLVGGVLLALHTFTIKYSAQVQLEAVPLLASALCVVAYDRSRVAATARWSGWLLLSGAALGLTAASKYPFAIVGLVVLVHWAGARWLARGAPSPGRAWPLLLGWGGLAVAIFLLVNPWLWPDPLGRLGSSFAYHFGYAHSPAVQKAAMPPWQPVAWLVRSAAGWHKGVFLPGADGVDLAFTLLAFAGLPRLGRERPLYLLWIGLALAFLFVWPTKWPQYVLLVVFPWSLAAAAGLREVLAWAGAGVRRLREAPVAPGGT
ncbi:MAG: phospholipid carrier-dependent glycosyltransferase [Anaeromyxobacter sp.]